FAVFGVTLQQLEDDVLLAGAGNVFDSHRFGGLQQFGNGLLFQLSEVHRRAEAGMMHATFSGFDVTIFCVRVAVGAVGIIAVGFFPVVIPVVVSTVIPAAIPATTTTAVAVATVAITLVTAAAGLLALTTFAITLRAFG